MSYLSYYMALGELHEYSQKKEIKMRRELKSGMRGRWTPFLGN